MLILWGDNGMLILWGDRGMLILWRHTGHVNIMGWNRVC